jgi:hypothetical protein
MHGLANSYAFWIVVFVVLAVVYLLPALIGMIRGVDRLALVFLVNLIGAPTRIGWVAAAVEAPEHSRADHALYIRAVRRGLEARDIRVAEMGRTISGDGRREATLLLRPDEDAFAERVPAEASASWDEDNGWSLLVRHESLTCECRKPMPPGDIHESRPLRGHTAGPGADPGLQCCRVAGAAARPG